MRLFHFRGFNRTTRTTPALDPPQSKTTSSSVHINIVRNLKHCFLVGFLWKSLEFASILMFPSLFLSGKVSKFTATIVCSMLHTLKTFHCRRAMTTRVNRVSPSDGWANSIWTRYVWTGKFMNPEKKNLRIQKYPDNCGRGPKFSLTWHDLAISICSCEKKTLTNSPCSKTKLACKFLNKEICRGIIAKLRNLSVWTMQQRKYDMESRWRAELFCSSQPGSSVSGP